MTAKQLLTITLLFIFGAAFAALAHDDAAAPEAAATLLNVEGSAIGQVVFSTLEDGKIEIAVIIEAGQPGFHGFHIHSIGVCDASTERPFTSASGHLVLGSEALAHPNHNGDLPTLLVMADGTASAVYVTDRFTIADLFDEDGSAVIFHAGEDNHAHIPTDRYEPDPDEMTLNTGDAGGRAGCGIVQVPA